MVVTWENHIHVATSWSPCGYHMVATWLPSGYLIGSCHFVIMWLSSGCHLGNMYSPHGWHLATMWLSFGRHFFVAMWPSYKVAFTVCLFLWLSCGWHVLDMWLILYKLTSCVEGCLVWPLIPTSWIYGQVQKHYTYIIYIKVTLVRKNSYSFCFVLPPSPSHQ